MAMTQDPIKIGGTDSIYKAYFSGLCKGISLQNMALYGTVPPFWDPGIPIEKMVLSTDSLHVVIFDQQGYGFPGCEGLTE
jgi:hypothetical protein